MPLTFTTLQLSGRDEASGQYRYIVRVAPPNRRLPISMVSIEPNCPSCPGEPHTTVEQVLAEEKKRPQGEASKAIARRVA